MPSDKAIEAALDAYYEGPKWRDLTSWAPRCAANMADALIAAYAIDGDFNAGVEAVAAKLERDQYPNYGDALYLAAEIRKLKR